MIRTLWLTLTACFLFSSAPGQVPDSQRRESSDIAKLARITRVDHSTIFFRGLTNAGYVRNGEVYKSAFSLGTLRSDLNYCHGEAASHDGLSIVYATVADTADTCEIVVRDLKTGKERNLGVIERRTPLFSWSWDNKEIAYQSSDAITAVSTADRSKRILGRLPPRVPTDSWTLRAIEWLHHQPEVILDVNVCIPTREPATCNTQNEIVLLSPNGSQVLVIGACAAVSPADDQIAYIAHDKVLLIDANGFNRRVVANMPPAFLFLPFLRESPWSAIVWSPKGDRLWFNTIIDEGGNANLYLVDVRSGHRKRVLKRTLIRITGWSQ